MLVLIVVIIIDLHRTASVLSTLDIAGAIVAARGEGTGTSWFAGGRGAHGRALVKLEQLLLQGLELRRKLRHTRETTRSLYCCCSSASSETLGGRSGIKGPSSLTFGGRGGPGLRELASEYPASEIGDRRLPPLKRCWLGLTAGRLGFEPQWSEDGDSGVAYVCA